MIGLRELIQKATAERRAVGHFNFSNLEGFWAIVRAAEGLKVPVILGLSEGERDFVGLRQAVALVRSWRESAESGGQPVFLNADHTYSFERVKEAVDAGCDAVIFDGAKLSLEENIQITKQCVVYAKSQSVSRRTDIVVEGELGYIGTSSRLLDEVPADITALAGANLTDPEIARRFVAETGVDLLAPAVGNIHGMLKDRPDPALDLERVGQIRAAAGVPLVLHGASGNSDGDIKAAIQAGVAVVHINTELRAAYRDALKLSLQENLDEVAPYKILKPALAAMQKVAERKLKLFNSIV